MKKYVIIAATALFSLLISSCSSSKPTVGEGVNPYGSRIAQNECETLAEAMPGKRAVGKGTSFDESVARQKAELDARAQMSRKLETIVIEAAKVFNYDFSKYSGDQNEGAELTDAAGKTNTLRESFSQNILNGTSVIKTEKFFGQNRVYTIFVCLEFDGTLKELAKKTVDIVKQRVSDDDRAKIDAAAEKFEQEVMRKLQN